MRQFEMQAIGRTDEMTQAYDAISVERRLRPNRQPGHLG